MLGLGGFYLPEEMDTDTCPLPLEEHCWPTGSEPPTPSWDEWKEPTGALPGKRRPATETCQGTF